MAKTPELGTPTQKASKDPAASAVLVDVQRSIGACVAVANIDSSVNLLKVLISHPKGAVVFGFVLELLARLEHHHEC